MSIVRLTEEDFLKNSIFFLLLVSGVCSAASLEECKKLANANLNASAENLAHAEVVEKVIKKEFDQGPQETLASLSSRLVDQMSQQLEKSRELSECLNSL